MERKVRVLERKQLKGSDNTQTLPDNRSSKNDYVYTFCQLYRPSSLGSSLLACTCRCGSIEARSRGELSTAEFLHGHVGERMHAKHYMGLRVLVDFHVNSPGSEDAILTATRRPAS